MGSAWSPEEEAQEGVIPTVMDELFSRVESEPNTDFMIKVSFVEIHKVCRRRSKQLHVWDMAASQARCRL